MDVKRKERRRETIEATQVSASFYSAVDGEAVVSQSIIESFHSRQPIV
jgi:hypothetical protein